MFSLTPLPSCTACSAWTFHLLCPGPNTQGALCTQDLHKRFVYACPRLDFLHLGTVLLSRSFTKMGSPLIVPGPHHRRLFSFFLVVCFVFTRRSLSLSLSPESSFLFSSRWFLFLSCLFSSLGSVRFGQGRPGSSASAFDAVAPGTDICTARSW